jgi:2-oxoglutarate ferredoxin oxidoreductase subunit gamma
VILAGVILGEAASRAGFCAVQTQSYGPESRGGAARSEVVISREPVDFPRVSRAQVLAALSQPGYDRYRDDVAEGGLVLVDSDLVQTDENAVAEPLPLSTVAEEVGHKIVANMVLLGYLTARLDLFSHQVLEATALDNVPPRTLELNRRALEAGRNLFASRSI